MSTVGVEERGVNVGGVSTVEWVRLECWFDMEIRKRKESVWFQDLYPEGAIRQNREEVPIQEITQIKYYLMFREQSEVGVVEKRFHWKLWKLNMS